MKRYQFQCSINFGDVFLQLILWFFLCIFTLGLASPFFIYYMAKLIINNTQMHEVQNTAAPVYAPAAVPANVPPIVS